MSQKKTASGSPFRFADDGELVYVAYMVNYAQAATEHAARGDTESLRREVDALERLSSQCAQMTGDKICRLQRRLFSRADKALDVRAQSTLFTTCSRHEV